MSMASGTDAAPPGWCMETMESDGPEHGEGPGGRLPLGPGPAASPARDTDVSEPEASIAAAPVELVARALDRLNARSAELSSLAGEAGYQEASAAMTRLVLRLPREDRDALDQLRARLRDEGGIDVSRADMMRFFVWCGLSAIDPERPLGAQLPVLILKRAGLPSARQPKPPPKREGTSMRQLILQRMSAAPEKVFTPARLALLVGASSRDSVRNTLLVLHAKGRIAKVGWGGTGRSSRRRRATQPACAGVLAPAGGARAKGAPAGGDGMNPRKDR
jgi:hypothetical protein